MDPCRAASFTMPSGFCLLLFLSPFLYPTADPRAADFDKSQVLGAGNEILPTQ
jgi:hypothetical protein